MRRSLPILLAITLSLTAASCGSDDGDEPAATTTTTTAPETVPETTEPDRTEERSSLVVAPVLSSGGCPADTAAVDPESGPFPTADGAFCYTVGEPGGDGNDLTDATLSETEGEFQVFTRIKPDSVDDLNTLFNACFAGEPTCPAGEGGRGYVAFIWDDVVLYAPAIQTEDLAEEGVSLAGGLTERKARELITLINR